ncbi:hypothetical protein EV401DRAFT_487171 [Pisolithus croceorrhizus]|nr:hypothetical protein EV401DRAFT_487171 [Pisolithus croceorrhizus]
MPNAETTTIEEGSVEGSLADQEQTSPEPQSHARRPPFPPSSHWGQPNDQRQVLANELAHYISRRSAGTRDASSSIRATGRTDVNTAARGALNPEDVPTPSSAGPSVTTTQVGSPGTDRKASWRAYTTSSDYSELRKPTDIEADPGAVGLDEPSDPQSVPPHISTVHPIPGLHANLRGHEKTPYVEMILAMDFIPNWYTLMAGISTWILLAGFVLFPATFASWATRPTDTVEYDIATIIRNMPLLVIAWVCTGLGGVGMLWLWWKWRRNYIWVVTRVFLPGLLNSVAGIIATVTNAYETQGNLSGSNVRATIIVTGAVAVICGVLAMIYQFVFIRRLRKDHERIEREMNSGWQNDSEQKGERAQVQASAEVAQPWAFALV